MLSEERTARLEALGFVWGDTHDAAWDESCRRLEAYRAEQVDCLVPVSYVTPDGGKLGVWVRRQRSIRKGKDSVMNEERATRLETLGFVWAVRARAYRCRRGRCRSVLRSRWWFWYLAIRVLIQPWGVHQKHYDDGELTKPRLRASS